MDRLRNTAHGSTVVLAILGTACGGGEGTGQSTARMGLDSPDAPITLTPTPVYRIGGFEAPEWASFAKIASVRFDADGNLYALDSQNKQIVVVDRTGGFVRTIGRPGEGPGEFNNPSGLALLADGTVTVYDLGASGFLLFDREGEYLRTVRVDLFKVGLPMASAMTALGQDIVAPVIKITMRTASGGADRGEPEGPPRRPVTRFSLSEDDEHGTVYDAWQEPPPKADTRTMGGGGTRVVMRMGSERAFTPPILTAVLEDGRIALVDSMAYQVKLIDPGTGTVSETLDRSVSPIPVTDAVQKAEKQRRYDALDDGGVQIVGAGGARVDQAAIRQMREQQIEGLTFMDEIPVIRRMAVDWNGRIWVERSALPGEDGPTDIISADRRYFGTVAPDGMRIPAAFGPDGLVAYIEKDEYDVPILVVKQLPPEWRTIQSS